MKLQNIYFKFPRELQRNSNDLKFKLILNAQTDESIEF